MISSGRNLHRLFSACLVTNVRKDRTFTYAFAEPGAPSHHSSALGPPDLETE